MPSRMKRAQTLELDARGGHRGAGCGGHACDRADAAGSRGRRDGERRPQGQGDRVPRVSGRARVARREAEGNVAPPRAAAAARTTRRTIPTSSSPATARRARRTHAQPLGEELLQESRARRTGDRSGKGGPRYGQGASRGQGQRCAWSRWRSPDAGAGNRDRRRGAHPGTARKAGLAIRRRTTLTIPGGMPRRTAGRPEARGPRARARGATAAAAPQGAAGAGGSAGKRRAGGRRNRRGGKAAGSAGCRQPRQ